MRDERLQKDAKVKAAKCLLQSPEVREERLQKGAKVKAAKRLLQGPEVRGERLQKNAKAKAVGRGFLTSMFFLSIPINSQSCSTVLFFFSPFFTSMFDKRLSHQENITIKLKMRMGYVLYYALLLLGIIIYFRWCYI